MREMAVVKKEATEDVRAVLGDGHSNISVVVPVYNEEKSVKSVIKDLQGVLETSGVNCELIVVDDGSTDRSAQILEEIEGIRYLRHEKNIGYGGALKTGIKNAKGEFIVITDADGTYPTEVIPELLNALDGYDMVVGARAGNDRNVPLIRRPVKWILGKLANYLSETDIPDLNSGFRAFKKDIVVRFYKMLPSGFSFTTTITLAMHCDGYRVKYIPIQYHKRQGKSKIRPIKDTINFIQLIWRTIMYFNPVKVFLPIAGVVFLGFMISALVDILISSNLTDKTVILFLAFIQISVIGLLADLIDKRSP
ncbi:MAG: glycosyltransferase family 2 protein [Candidatus Binatia bacterium]